MNLENQVALVTGAGRGMGRAIALSLGQAGAKVVVTALEGPEVTAVAEEIVGGGSSAVPIPADLLRPGEAERVFEEALRVYGRVDILVNNAGMHRWLPVLELPESEVLEKWDSIMRLNIHVPFRLCLKAISVMRQHGSGVIVNIASLAGLMAMGAGMCGYSSSKAALVALSRCLAEEVRAVGIRVYTICPGPVETVLYRVDVERRLHAASERMLQPEDVAQIAYALIAGERDAPLGEPIIVSKGWPIMVPLPSWPPPGKVLSGSAIFPV